MKQDLKDSDSIKVYEIRINEDRKYVYIDYGDSDTGTDYIKDDFD